MKISKGSVRECVIVGFGRAGHGLHFTVMSELRPELRFIIVDPNKTEESPTWPIVDSVEDAMALVRHPATAVFHVAVGVSDHASVGHELLERGARRLIIEKPLASSYAEAQGLVNHARDVGASLVPVAVWPHSTATKEVMRRLRQYRTAGARLHFLQQKVRPPSNARDASHATALDVEMPHQVLLAVHVIGSPAEVVASEVWGSSRLGAPAGMEGARIELRHRNGARSELVNVLTAVPRLRTLDVAVRGRRITVTYPSSRLVRSARLVDSHDERAWSCHDRPFAQFCRTAYCSFEYPGRRPPLVTLAQHLHVIDLLDQARNVALPGQ